MQPEGSGKGYARGGEYQLSAPAPGSRQMTAPTVKAPQTPPARVPPRRRKGQWFVGTMLMAVLCYAGYQVWHGFFRYQAFGTVVGRAIEISPPWNGIVRSVHVTEGEVVRQDQLLVTVDNVELQQRIAKLEDELRIAQADLEAEASKLKWRMAQNHDLHQETWSEYYRALGNLYVEEARLGEAKVTHQRMVGLHAQDKITSQQMEELAFQVQGLEKKVDNLRTALVELRKGLDLSSDLSADGADQLKPFFARIESLQTELARLRELLTMGEVKAPANGLVLRRHRYTGEHAPVTNPLLTLVEEGSLEIVLYCRQHAVGNIEEGDVLKVVVEPEPDPIRCRVARIGDQYEAAPAHIQRNYYARENLLPVYLKPLVSHPRLKIGATVKLPYSDERAPFDTVELGGNIPGR